MAWILNKPNFMTIWLYIFSCSNDSIAMVRVHTRNSWWCITLSTVWCYDLYRISLALFGLEPRAQYKWKPKHNIEAQRNEYLWKYRKIPWINVFVQSPKNLIKLYSFSNKFPPCTTECSPLQNLWLSSAKEDENQCVHALSRLFPLSNDPTNRTLILI